MLRGHPSIVLAVSGGLDSCCLLHLTHAMAGAESRLRVATFDHRTGPHSSQAAEHVVELARSCDLEVTVKRAGSRARSEGEWRAERWDFLRKEARRHDAVIATAHTRDDQLETVIMRLMRGAGARGLAALLAESPGITRPLVGATRTVLANYAKLHGLQWVDDPTNQSRRFFRNRVRLDLLPALRTTDPTLPAALLGLAEQAAALRLDMERLVRPWVRRDDEALVVAESVLALPSQEARAACWPALLGPQQVVLDRRGIDRLSTLELATPYGSRVQLAGGWEGTRVEGGVRIRRAPESCSAPVGHQETLPARGRVRFGRWTFEVLTEAPPAMPDDAWSVWLPDDALASVRSWEDGDRIAAGQQGTPRRVKRFFSDRRIAANDRKGWPVVIADGEIIWIPGIRRATAVAVRSGRPVRLVVCERIHV